MFDKKSKSSNRHTRSKSSLDDVENYARSVRYRFFKKAKEDNQREFRQLLNSFIKEKFSFKECIRYVPDTNQPVLPGSRIGVPQNSEQPWNVKADIRRIKPTNAFGQIEFLSVSSTNQKPVEYIRISDEDEISDVMELITKYWGLMQPRKPSLCISVIGGAKNFKLEGKKKEVFHHAAQTTEAWIVTSGLNLGIIKVVGDALLEGQTYHHDQRKISHQLRCLGIAPWGYVLNRQSLISSGSSHPIPYRVSNEVKTGHPVSLNQNHTHYIFVDEGLRNRYGGCESAKFRAKLEKYIAMPLKDGGWGIPVVLVVVEGGHDVLIDARNSIREHVPIVICCGTGRAADILYLAFSYRQKHSKTFVDFDETESDEIKEKLLNVSGAKKTNDAYWMIVEIVKDPNYITVFDMNKSDDLDLSILYALIKTSSNVLTQLNLALAWNRIDIAEDKIFQQELPADSTYLEGIMMSALLNDKVDFVRLLLQNGVVMRQFLTFERLHILYNESHRASGLYRLLVYFGLDPGRKKMMKNCEIINELELEPTESEKTNEEGEGNQFNIIGNYSSPSDLALSIANQITFDDLIKRPCQRVFLSTIKTLIRRMVGRYSNRIYDLDTRDLYSKSKKLKAVRMQTFGCPFQELFLWAVLHQRQSMAKFFWERCEDAITLALVACNLYKSAAKALPSYDTETVSLFQSYLEDFEDLAVQVLEECNEIEPDTTSFLIERRIHLWGQYNCLELAAKCNARRFVSSIACQNSLDFTWCNGIQTTPLKIAIGLVFPLIVISPRLYSIKESPNLSDDLHGDDLLADVPNGNGADGKKSSFIGQVMSKFGLKKTDQSLKKIQFFYTCPKTKFFLNAFTYVVFLIYFSYTLMFAILPDKFTPFEMVLMIYIGSMIIDEIREVCLTPGDSIFGQFRVWWFNSPWNRFDVLIVFISLLSCLLRLGRDEYFVIAKTSYAVTCIFFYMRLFRLYAVNQNLGPKLVMIERMMRELMIFVFILSVVLVSYGVAFQAVMYPYKKKFDWITVRNVFFYPYWSLYGEMNIEEAMAEDPDCNTGDGDECPKFNFFGPLLMALYLLIGFILLINLLIAIFSNVFQQVEDNSIEIWKFNMFSLVEEYQLKPLLPLPFSAIQAFIELAIFLSGYCQRRKKIETGLRNLAEELHPGLLLPDLPLLTQRNSGQQSTQPVVNKSSQQSRGEFLGRSNGLANISAQQMQSSSLDEGQASEYSHGDEDSEFNPADHMGDVALEAFQDDSITEILENDHERLLRRFEVNCLKSLLLRKKEENQKTTNARIARINIRAEELSNQMTGLVDKLDIDRRIQKSISIALQDKFGTQLCTSSDKEAIEKVKENSDRILKKLESVDLMSSKLPASNVGQLEKKSNDNLLIVRDRRLSDSHQLDSTDVGPGEIHGRLGDLEEMTNKMMQRIDQLFEVMNNRTTEQCSRGL